MSLALHPPSSLLLTKVLQARCGDHVEQSVCCRRRLPSASASSGRRSVPDQSLARLAGPRSLTSDAKAWRSIAHLPPPLRTTG